MSGGWAQFRKTWIKPEVYPLIGSMVVALGVCGTALANKISQPGLTFSKSARKGGIHAQLEGIDEVRPMWSGSKNYSSSIFTESKEIQDTNRKVFSPALAEAADNGGVLEVIKEAPAVIEEAIEDAVEAVQEVVSGAIHSAADAVIEAHKVAEDKVEDAISELVAAQSEEELLEKGAALASQLKKIVPEPPSATA